MSFILLTACTQMLLAALPGIQKSSCSPKFRDPEIENPWLEKANVFQTRP
jgi:hypothetical protein